MKHWLVPFLAAVLSLAPALGQARAPWDAIPCMDRLIHDPQGAEVSECRLGPPGAPPADRA